jgi:hypothetical protein
LDPLGKLAAPQHHPDSAVQRAGAAPAKVPWALPKYRKTISKKNGVYNFAAKKSGPNYQFRYTLNDCHFFALYCVEDKTIAWIRAEEATLSKKSFNLRADQAKNSQKKNVLWLSNYTDVMRVLRDYEQNT